MRPLAAGLLLLCACSGGGGGGDSNPPPPPLVTITQVSGLSPFTADCGGVGGTNFLNSEVEPHLAVDPLNANHLIGVWQQDRWSNGSSRGNLTGVSLDGGATWTLRAPPLSVCAGGNEANGANYLRATDPWVTIAPDGVAYQSSVSSTGGTFGIGSSNAILVSRSLDGGITWSAPATLIRDGSAFFNDKETITADPNDARFVYAVWDRLINGGNGPTVFARTADAGATWEGARVIFDPGPNQQTIGNLIRVLPDGTVVNFYAHLHGDEDSVSNASLEVIRSTDHGVTWSAPIRISDFRPVGAVDPNTAQPIRDGAIIPQMAAAPNGALYAVWQDGRFSGGARDGIAFSRSTDGGLTWSAPARINGEPSAAAFTPQVHVRADGTIGVTYFDLRSDTADTATLLADYWILRSRDGGATWRETHVDGPFNVAAAPIVGGAFFLGDYMGLASAGTTFLAFYTRTTPDATNRTNIYLARIAPATTAAADAAAARPADPSATPGNLDARAFDNLRRARSERRVR